MNELELKDNLCEVNFICFEKKLGDCVHHKNKKQCKFYDKDYYTCSNAIAQVQAITRCLKNVGIKFNLEGVEK